MYRVNNYDTGSVLDGRPSAELVDASADAEPTGAVAAYLERGVWKHAPTGQESRLRASGHEVVTVWIDEP